MAHVPLLPDTDTFKHNNTNRNGPISRWKYKKRFMAFIGGVLIIGVYLVYQYHAENKMGEFWGKQSWGVSNSDGSTQFNNISLFETLFKNIDFKYELHHSINGTPLNLLENVRNPCWLSRLTSPDPYNTTWADQATDRLLRMRHVYEERFHSNQSWRLRCMPLAFVIGVSKSGTSDLYEKLLMHPQIQGGDKQTAYWNKGRLGFEGELPVPFQSYVDIFDETADTIAMQHQHSDRTGYHPEIILEATGSYLWDYDGWWTLALNRGLSQPRYILADTFRRLIPKVRLIAILRNPTDRLYSMFRMKSPESSTELFHDLCLQQIQRWNACIERHSIPRVCAYNGSVFANEHTSPGGITLRASLYVIFLRDWLRVFTHHQIMVIRAEKYYANRSSVLPQIFRFLGVRKLNFNRIGRIGTTPIKNTKSSFARRSKEPMLNITKTLLDAFFQPFNAELAEFMENEDFLWRR